MSITINDRFEIYYREKLWEMIPAIYRHEDGLAQNPDVLKAIIEVIAEQAAILRRSEDRLWEDQFIETCDGWAVPYIGNLVATRLLSAQNERGQIIDVAKTIYYRRRKGTPRILEELIYDVSRWDGKLVEGFRRLARARHGLDPHPVPLAGRFTGTLPGGFTDLRSASGAELSRGPFDEYFHTPDFRKPRGLNGLYGITKLDFFIYRLFAYPLKKVTPFKVAITATNAQYTFDPSGRSIPLFNERKRPGADWDSWHSAFEWELPLPIRCRLLGNAEYLVQEKHIQTLLVVDVLITTAEADQLRKFIGLRFRNEGSFKTRAGFISAGALLKLMSYAIVQDCGKQQLWPATVAVNIGGVPVQREVMIAAGLSNWSVNTNQYQLAVDAERGRFMFFDGNDRANLDVDYCYGFSGECGAGSYFRKNVDDLAATPVAGDIVIPAQPAGGTILGIPDNANHKVPVNATDILNLTIQAGNQRRPYLVLQNDWILDTGAGVDSTLVLDGLWLGSPGNSKFNIILRGDYECVIIRNCTFDPGGDTNAKGETIFPVALIVEAAVENLCIEKSILGPVFTQAGGFVEDDFRIMDSIVQSVDDTVDAISVDSGKITMLRTTVFGKVTVHRMYASNSIITGKTNVTDTQTGCFRFSAAPEDSRLPKPFESFLFLTDHHYWFTSRVFGQPGYAQLSDVAPVELYRGAENRVEMGVFNFLINAVKYDGLKIKIEEYMPFGLIPAFINET